MLEVISKLLRQYLNEKLSLVKTKTDLIPTNPGKGIRSIQRGTAVVSQVGGNFSATLATPLVNVNRSVVEILGMISNTGTYDNNPANTIRWVGLTTTQITFNARSFADPASREVAYQITEYYA